MQFVAINWHIYVLTHSAFALGLVGFLRFIPILFFSLIGGSVADAHNRKKILFITQSSLAILSFIIAYLTLSGNVNVNLIFVITVLFAIGLSFDMPARQAFVPGLVDKKHLANAMSLNSIMFETSSILGPAISGFLIAKTGLGSIYTINALSFLAVLTSLYFIKTTGAVEGSIFPPVA
jgi:MFS family permease